MKKVDEVVLAVGWITPILLETKYGISKSTQAILRMKKHQQNDLNPLPFTKIGKRILYNVKQIEKWLLAKQQENQA